MAYQFPLNGGRINASIGGNSTSAGAGYALVSTGTLLLAGGNNITLSQNGNTISIGAPTQTNQTLNISAVGNTTGQSASSTYDARTLSIDGGGMVSVGWSNSSLRISATQSVQTQSRFNATLAGNSTSAGEGYIQISSGVMTLAGGNNITLSQNGNAVTISAFTQTAQTQNLHNVTLAGNSTSAGAGYIQVSSGTLTLAGGNNITLSQNGNAVTVSAFTQTVQTQSRFNLTLAGNSTSAGAGYIQISSGTMQLAGGNNITLSQNGNSVTISGGAGAGGGIALANSQATYNTGTVNLLEGGGAITIASSAGGQSFKVSVPATSSLSATGGVSISTNGSTISIGAPAFSAGMSNIGNSTGTSGTVSNRMIFAGGTNITLSQSTGAGGNTISVVAPAITGSRQISVANAAGTVTISGNRRVVVVTVSATPSINTDNGEVFTITGLNTNITSFTTNLTGTPISGQTLWIAITDNGTPRTLAWGTSFEASTVALPTTTVASTRLDVGFVWNTVTSKWRCIAVA